MLTNSVAACSRTHDTRGRRMFQLRCSHAQKVHVAHTLCTYVYTYVYMYVHIKWVDSVRQLGIVVDVALPVQFQRGVVHLFLKFACARTFCGFVLRAPRSDSLSLTRHTQEQYMVSSVSIAAAHVLGRSRKRYPVFTIAPWLACTCH